MAVRITLAVALARGSQADVVITWASVGNTWQQASPDTLDKRRGWGTAGCVLTRAPAKPSARKRQNHRV